MTAALSRPVRPLAARLPLGAGAPKPLTLSAHTCEDYGLTSLDTPLDWLRLAYLAADQAGAKCPDDVVPTLHNAIECIEADALAAHLVARSVATGRCVEHEASSALVDALYDLGSAGDEEDEERVFSGRSEGQLWRVRLTREGGSR